MGELLEIEWNLIDRNGDVQAICLATSKSEAHDLFIPVTSAGMAYYKIVPAPRIRK